MNTLLTLLLIMPFVAALLIMFNRFTVKRTALRDQLTRWITIIFPLLIALIAVILFFKTNKLHPLNLYLFEWLHVGSFSLHIALLFDTLSAWMILFILLISALIFIYASGYMRGDPGYSRFFIYFHLFLGSMLLLVLANNPIIMYLGWEGVGLCSYLLIGFYFKDKQNVRAANKAFYLNRIGDFGFVTALGLLFISIGSQGMDYQTLSAHIASIDSNRLNLIATLFFVGAMGKSAQIPLYVWLPDAMAGPTPVSALIHAATMVTAGVYMVVRLSFLYELTPQVGLFIAYIGAFSALLAALFASFASDIKKILAYSTMSQLGYMFIGAGLGAYSAAMFHLFTHAFFKALLFMGAGAVIIAMHHEQNIFKMGNLRRYLPLVFITMFVATLAITGIPPFSGFFSKDAIMAHSYFQHHYLIWGIATLTAFLTAYYMFRLLFAVFYAKNKAPIHLQILPISMLWTLIILALFATINGLWNLPDFMGGSEAVSRFLALPDRHLSGSHAIEWALALLNTLMALLGMVLAYKFFAKTSREPNVANRSKSLLVHTFYIDRLYFAFFAKGLFRLSHFFSQSIEPLIVGLVVQTARGYRYLAYIVNQFQNGDVRSYLFMMFLGVLLITFYLIFTLKVFL